MARTSDEDPNEPTETEKRTEELARALSREPSPWRQAEAEAARERQELEGEEALRERRGYVPFGPLVLGQDELLTPEEAAVKHPGFQIEDAFTIKDPTELAGEALGIEALALGNEVLHRKASEAHDAGFTPEAATCELCNTPLKTQKELNDQDFDDLEKLSGVLHGLLRDRHPGIAMWAVATSDTLNSISVILKRSGI